MDRQAEIPAAALQLWPQRIENVSQALCHQIGESASSHQCPLGDEESGSFPHGQRRGWLAQAIWTGEPVAWADTRLGSHQTVQFPFAFGVSARFLHV